MEKYGLPTAPFGIFSEPDEAISFARENRFFVVKADGLAAGKGVIVCDNEEEAEAAINKIMVEKAFGDAGNKVVIEKRLEGEEASILAFSDGENIQLMVSSQDHKRVFDADKGQNTGGMGAYSPAPVVNEALREKIMKEIMQPAIDALAQEGTPYKGVLYAGLMIDAEGPKVLEFNARFGDPETQVVLPRMKSDLIPVMEACIDGKLAGQKIEWDERAATCVVLASGGYPGSYEKGKIINGLEEAAKLPGTYIFHAGTKAENGKILTNGGRVLGVTALGQTIRDSINNAYAAVSKISFEHMHYRRDIGKRALKC
jgi:phosphoribosylamine--glycine ligase